MHDMSKITTCYRVSATALGRAVALCIGLACATGLAACAGWLGRTESIDPTTLPSNMRADYAVFAERCSKCHSLARPLSSGIDDDDYWAMYVARMRRQPASGISQEDTVVILRFLHFYSEEQRAKKAERSPTPAPTLSGTGGAG
jgi:hypothetical protein